MFSRNIAIARETEVCLPFALSLAHVFTPSSWEISMPDLSPETLRAHSVNPRQFIDAMPSTLADGQRILHVYNTSGLHFTILPDRGMDIFTAHYNGLPLTWISQNAPHSPDYGSAWLRQFNGGLLTTCGYTHVGPPERDTLTGEQRDLHGNATRLKATDVAVTVTDNTLTIRALMSENRLFGEQLQIERVYRLTLGVPTITIEDTVTNKGDMPCPLMVLYHFNVGYPLVRGGTQLHASSNVLPRDAAAQPGLSDWMNYHAPEVGYAEQVFYHQCKTHNGDTQVVLANDDLALALSWDTTHSPYFTQWKNTRQGVYVSGIEPGNCVPEGQNSARQHERLIMLQPNETHHFRNTLTVAHQPEQIAAMKQNVQTLNETGVLVERFGITA